MSKKRLNEDAIQSELNRSAFFKPKDSGEETNTAQSSEQKVEQKAAQKVAQLSNSRITTDVVETLDFNLRKTAKAKFNANIPVEWKEEIDQMALDLKVGKYELGAFLIAQALGKVK
jgi:hypothetical protein